MDEEKLFNLDLRAVSTKELQVKLLGVMFKQSNAYNDNCTGCGHYHYPILSFQNLNIKNGSPRPTVVIGVMNINKLYLEEMKEDSLDWSMAPNACVEYSSLIAEVYGLKTHILGLDDDYVVVVITDDVTVTH